MWKKKPPDLIQSSKSNDVCVILLTNIGSAPMFSTYIVQIYIIYIFFCGNFLDFESIWTLKSSRDLVPVLKSNSFAFFLAFRINDGSFLHKKVGGNEGLFSDYVINYLV